MFADVLQMFAMFFCFFKKNKLILRAPWTIFHIFTQNLEKLDPGAVFARRECFFRIPRVFLVNLASFSSLFEQSGPFPAGFSVS